MIRRLPELTTRANEIHPAISPDGKWLAYVSDSAGEYNVYLRPLAAPGSSIRVSRGHGMGPIWAPDMSAIYFRNESGDTVYAAPFANGEAEQPRALFSGHFLEDWPWGRNYDLGPDGRFLLMTKSGTILDAREIRVVLNWAGAITANKARVP